MLWVLQKTREINLCTLHCDKRLLTSSAAPVHTSKTAAGRSRSYITVSPVGDRSATSKIHLDSDAMVLAVNAINATGSIDTSKPEAVILAFRGTEPLELADLQSDFRTVPELGKWGRVHLGFLGALGLDKDLEYATGGCALTYT